VLLTGTPPHTLAVTLTSVLRHIPVLCPIPGSLVHSDVAASATAQAPSVIYFLLANALCVLPATPLTSPCVFVCVPCRCPPECLSFISSKAEQQQMVAAGASPRVRSIMMVGPSRVVPGEWGCFGWLPPGNGWDEWESDSTQQRLHDQYHALLQASSSSSSSASNRARIGGPLLAPCLSWNFTLYYLGQYRLTALPGDGDLAGLAVTAAEVSTTDAEVQQGSKRQRREGLSDGGSCSSHSEETGKQPPPTYYVDPKRLSGTGVLYNMGHGAAATLKGRIVQFVSAAGMDEPPQFMLETVRPPLQQQEQQERQQQQEQEQRRRQQGQHAEGPPAVGSSDSVQHMRFVEHLWDYEAGCTLQDDELLTKPCLCWVCKEDRAKGGTGHMMATYIRGSD